MTPDSLKAFLAVAQLGSFSLASQRLHITQPAVSKRIAALEHHLGLPLFQRVNRHIELTPSGKLLQSRAEQILNAIRSAERELADQQGQVQGELRVATSHHIGLHKLPPLLHDFVARYPLVNLRFEFLDSEVAQQRVLKGQCELAVVTFAPEPSPLLKHRLLWDDPLCFVASPSLAAHLTPSLDALSRAPAILPDLNTHTGRLLHQCFAQQGLSLNIAMATNYLETIKMLVSVGLGWSLLPATLIDTHMCALPVPVSLCRQLGAVYHPKRQLSRAAEAFLGVLGEGGG